VRKISVEGGHTRSGVTRGSHTSSKFFFSGINAVVTLMDVYYSDERTDHGMQQYSLENVNRRDLVETPKEERIAECGTKLRRGRGGGECVGRGAMADSDRSEVERAVGPRETSGGKFDRRDLFKEIRLKTD
jgi:hypothetical protein